MKLYTIGCILAVSVITLASCQKTYKCTCYSPSLNRSTPASEVKGNKKTAEEKCKTLPISGRYTGDDYICNLE